MAYTLDTGGNSTTMTLEDYVDHITSTVDLNDTDSVLDSAQPLSALSRDPQLMVDYLNGQLASCEDLNRFERFTEYGATNFILRRAPGFAIRANLWLPPEGDALQRESIHKLGVYQVPHDHDFSFLTVGYWGPGYTTSIYEYDPTSCSGVVGSKVDMQFLETTELTQGKVMYYRASQDIHTQEYPSGPSVSINLLITPDRPRTQYLFDTDTGTVSGVLANRAENSVGLCTLARHVGDASTVSRLDSIAATSSDPRIRWAAYDSLLSLAPDATSELMHRALTDSHPLVQELGTSVLTAEPAPTPDKAYGLTPWTYKPYPTSP